MSRWELRTEGCKIPLARDTESGEWIGHSEVAEFFVSAHNADIDALEAERDEWKRRCEAIAAWINTNNDDGLHLWLLAIAEGRDNG